MSLFPHLPQFLDCGLALSLPEHLESDLQLQRNPLDEPSFLANVIAQMVLLMTKEQQILLGTALGYNLKVNNAETPKG